MNNLNPIYLTELKTLSSLSKSKKKKLATRLYTKLEKHIKEHGWNDGGDVKAKDAFSKRNAKMFKRTLGSIYGFEPYLQPKG